MPATRSRTPGSAGFSMVELVFSIGVMLVLTAIAVPSLTHSLRAYQLNSAAASVSDMLKLTRFEAVRRNKQINFLAIARGAGWVVGTDSNANGAIDPLEKQQSISGYVTLLPAGGPVPPPNAITAADGALTAMSGANGSITFDARGAIRQGIGGPVANSVYLFYVGNANGPEAGYRAVVLLPSGSTQIWSAPSGGPWRQVS